MSVEIVVPTNCQEAGTPPGEVHERVTRIGEWLGNPREWNEETQLLCFFFRGVFIRAKKFCLDIFFCGFEIVGSPVFQTFVMLWDQIFKIFRLGMKDQSSA